MKRHFHQTWDPGSTVLNFQSEHRKVTSGGWRRKFKMSMKVYGAGSRRQQSKYMAGAA